LRNAAATETKHQKPKTRNQYSPFGLYPLA